MIDIRINRNLQLMADAWCDDLTHFLKEEQVANKRPYAHVGGRRQYFDTRLQKYKFELCNKGKERLDSEQRRKLLIYIDKFISNFNCIIKSDKKQIESLVLEQDSWDNEVKIIIKEVFVKIYEDFIHHDSNTQQDIGYKYMKMLNVRTCPYCNRQYTFTIRRDRNDEGKFCTRPEFDHFYEKSNYPLLALSFFNLIPSCHECNHGKLTGRVGVNPYFNGFSSKFRIQDNHMQTLNKNEIQRIRNIDEFTLGFDNPTEEENYNIQSFGLLSQYKEHRDYVQEIIEKSVTYDTVLKQGILETFQGTFHSLSDIHQFVWGKYLDNNNYENCPLSKLTNDILDQLGIIK